jgi:hypothetical protein
LLDFSSCPDDTVAYLKEHLKPLKIDQSDLDDLLHELGSDDEKVWKPAFEKLQYFDPRLNMDLATLIQNTPEPVERNRLIEVLSQYPPGTLKGRTVTLRQFKTSSDYYFKRDGEVMPRGWVVVSKVSDLDSDTAVHLAKWVRADRAIVLLQHIGTPAALAILREMATGNADARPTVIAKIAVESLEESMKEGKRR